MAVCVLHAKLTARSPMNNKMKTDLLEKDRTKGLWRACVCMTHFSVSSGGYWVLPNLQHWALTPGCFPATRISTASHRRNKTSPPASQHLHQVGRRSPERGALLHPSDGPPWCWLTAEHVGWTHVMEGNREAPVKMAALLFFPLVPSYKCSC